MRERQRVASRLQPSQRLLLVAVMSVGIVVTAPSSMNDTGATTTPQIGRASEPPLEASSTPGPPVTTQPESAPATDPAAMVAAAPVRLQIPSIGVDSELVDLGLQTDGTLEVPPSGFPAGWYTGAPRPGELGPAIIAGHVDWGGQPGVFFDLRELSTGDEIAITRQDGSTPRFRVTHVEQFAKDVFPTRAVYGDLDHAGLRLITCGGSFDRQMRSYDDNLVVFAELV